MSDNGYELNWLYMRQIKWRRDIQKILSSAEKVEMWSNFFLHTFPL